MDADDGRDIGRQRALTAEQRLTETERRFETMADCAPVLLWMSRTDSLCTFFNQTWLTFTGRTLAEEWGVGWAEGVHPEDFQRCVDTYLEAFNLRGSFEMEYRLRRADGEYRWVLDRGTPRYAPDGAFAGYIGSCVDITDHKKMEAELRAAVRVRDDFLSIASHELRTPLTPLQLQVQSLHAVVRKLAPGEVAETLGARIEVIERQFVRLTKVIDNLLDLSRVSAGRLSLELEDVDLADVVRAVVERRGDELTKAGCEVTVRGETSLRGRLDPLRLEQVLANLLANAAKYGAGKPIVVTLTTDGERARLSVRDHGIGVAAGDHARIFQRFERAVSVNHYGGFGLGLWIVRQIVEALGGSVRVESELGAGATFVVELPLATPGGVAAGPQSR